MNDTTLARIENFRGDNRRTKPGNIISALKLESEINELERRIAEWIAQCDPEMHEALKWQFLGGSKYFRPVTVYSCFQATHDEELGDEERMLALVVELIHNMTLVVDDILDKSRYRRQRLTLHCRFGNLPALMTSGFITAEAFRIVSDNPRAVRLISELVSRLGVAECLQWRVRSQPLGVEDWRQIAREDTGSMFEVSACLGAHSERLRKFGQLLGLLYHGCDDVADVRGVEALGGGGEDDIRDGILTLPAAIAIRDPDVSALFCDPTKRATDKLAAAFQAALPEAERYLDKIAGEARDEARRHAQDPHALFTLIDYTRSLSRR